MCKYVSVVTDHAFMISNLGTYFFYACLNRENAWEYLRAKQRSLLNSKTAERNMASGIWAIMP